MIDDILNERQKTHGDFRDNSWAYMRLIQVLRPRDSIIVESNPVICAALDEIAMKLARISRGDCRFKDHWFDIIGYCTIVLREIEREQTEMQERVGENDSLPKCHICEESLTDCRCGWPKCK